MNRCVTTIVIVLVVERGFEVGDVSSWVVKADTSAQVFSCIALVGKGTN